MTKKMKNAAIVIITLFAFGCKENKKNSAAIEPSIIAKVQRFKNKKKFFQKKNKRNLRQNLRYKV